MWKTLYSSTKATLSGFFFPSFCLHCDGRIEKVGLCSVCLEYMQLLDPTGRCPACFNEQGACMHTKEHIYHSGACFDSLSSAKSYVKNLTSLDSIRHKNIGSLCIVQLCYLQWPLPDVILTVSEPNRSLKNIAYHMGSYHTLEVYEMKMRSAFSQHAGYYLPLHYNISDKRCLILSMYELSEDDKTEISHTLQKAAASNIYFLALILGK